MGNCIGVESDDESQLFQAGVYLDGKATGALLEGGLNDRIILEKSNVSKTLIVPPNVNEVGRCDLQYYKQLDQMGFNNGAAEVVRSIDDVFTLDCGSYSQPAFRFADKELHDALVLASEKHNELKREFYEKKKRLSIAAFFVPFIVFFGAWVLICTFAGLIRFVRFGRNPV